MAFKICWKNRQTEIGGKCSSQYEKEADASQEVQRLSDELPQNEYWYEGEASQTEWTAEEILEREG